MIGGGLEGVVSGISEANQGGGTAAWHGWGWVLVFNLVLRAPGRGGGGGGGWLVANLAGGAVGVACC